MTYEREREREREREFLFSQLTQYRSTNLELDRHCVYKFQHKTHSLARLIA